jgi:hypothetical protein
MKVRDLFDLFSSILLETRYMIDSYVEPDTSSEDIPTQTLDDIIDEIKGDTPEPEPNVEEVTDESEDDTPEEKSTMEVCTEYINLLVVEKNALYNNAEMDGILDMDASNLQHNKIKKTCASITNVLSNLYNVLETVVDLFMSDDNNNDRSKFIITSYRALVGLSVLVQKIYASLNEKSYLASINGPIQSDYDHWFTEEVQAYLKDVYTWQNTSDLKKLDLMDEAIQFDLKYAALLKKLVISEFKGFDEYYTELIRYLNDISNSINDYIPPYSNYDTGSNMYEPDVIAKASAISLTVRTYFPPMDE